MRLSGFTCTVSPVNKVAGLWKLSADTRSVSWAEDDRDGGGPLSVCPLCQQRRCFYHKVMSRAPIPLLSLGVFRYLHYIYGPGAAAITSDQSFGSINTECYIGMKPEARNWGVPCPSRLALMSLLVRSKVSFVGGGGFSSSNGVTGR